MTGKKVILDSEISPEFIQEVCGRLSEDKQIRRTLPGSGRLHIDRKLPFLCVYRRPGSGFDPGTANLVKGEASYLIASSSARHKAGISSLVKAVVETLSQTPKAFLIIEIWTGESPASIIDSEGERASPSFRIFIPPDRIPSETVDSLKKNLSRIVVSKKKGEVSTVFSSRPWPSRFSPLLSSKDITRFNCFLVGLEIAPIFKDPDTNEVYPMVLKKLHRGLSTALQRSVFEFSRKRTTLRPPSYKSLGRKAMVKAVWEVDQQLAAISNEFEFLLLVTPVNIEQSFNKFRSCQCDCEPVFYYRPITVDPSVLKRKLFDIPFDRIEDPTLLSLFHDKLVELERKFSMLRDRNTRNFFYGSMQLFGEFDNELIRTARILLNKLPPHTREYSGGKKVKVEYFAEKAREEINRYRAFFPDLNSKVIVRDDITGLMVSQGNLFIGKRVQIAESRVEALIQHEVGTHVLTYLNGRNQPFQQLYCGLAGSDELQEGLAVLSEYFVGGLSPPRMRLLAGRVIAVKCLIDGASFMDTFKELNSGFGFSIRTAFIITSRIYRGGGFTKDAIYLRGLMKLVNYLREGGKLQPLFTGKISIEDVPLVSELQYRKVLSNSVLLPQYFENPQFISILDSLLQGEKIFNII